MNNGQGDIDPASHVIDIGDWDGRAARTTARATARVARTIPVDVRATLAVALAWIHSTSGYSFFNEMPEFCLAAFFSFSISFFCLLDFGGLFCAFFCSLFAMISSFPYVTEIKTDTTLTLLRVLYQIQCQCGSYPSRFRWSISPFVYAGQRLIGLEAI